MAFADGDLVDADHLWLWLPGTAEFLPHILQFKFLYRSAVKMEFFRNVLDR